MNARSFQRADANNSQKLTNRGNIQMGRTSDLTTGMIALQLNDTLRITVNRAVINNQIFSSIGNIVEKADVTSWDALCFRTAVHVKKY